ncbi:alpha-amylase family glycosyl hydrolase [Paenibacillus cremeus]
MQWSAFPNAGFTSGTPWLQVNPNYKKINADEAMSNPDSVYHYYIRLIALRKEHPVMIYGDYKDLLPEDSNLYVFVREWE